MQKLNVLINSACIGETLNSLLQYAVTYNPFFFTSNVFDLFILKREQLIQYTFAYIQSLQQLSLYLNISLVTFTRIFQGHVSHKIQMMPKTASK